VFCIHHFLVFIVHRHKLYISASHCLIYAECAKEFKGQEDGQVNESRLVAAQL